MNVGCARLGAVLYDENVFQQGQGGFYFVYQGQEFSLYHQCLEIRIVENIGEFIGDVAIVDIDVDGANLERRPHGFNPFDAIEAVNADVVAVTDALGLQVMSQLIRTVFHLAVGSALAFANQVFAVAVVIYGKFQNSGNIEKITHRVLAPQSGESG